MRYFIVFLFSLFTVVGYSQNDTIVNKLSGTVYHSETRLPMSSVHVINTTRVKGTTTDGNGAFEIAAKANHPLLVSYLGFDTIKVKV